jgi:hypothetical protein
MHARNGREIRPPELPQYSVDGYCADTRTVFKFYVCPCKHFRDVKKQGGDTLAQQYVRTMSRLQEIVKAGYVVVTMWDCAWDRDKVTERKPEQLTHPIVFHPLFRTRDALYVGRTCVCIAIRAITRASKMWM